MSIYRLGSSPIVNAVGIFRIAKSQFNVDRGLAIRLLVEGWDDLPEEVAIKALSGEIPVTFAEGDVVLIDASAPAN